MLRIIKNNTEATVLKLLKEFWETEPTKRCLYLRCSTLETEHEEWLSLLIANVEKHLDDEITEIFMCQDQDCLIFSRTLTHKRVNTFLSHLIPSLSPTPTPGLASLFEVGIHWNKLTTIIEKKIGKQNQLQAAKKQASSFATTTREELLNSIDPILLKSLPVRRQERDLPEILVVEDDAFSQKLVSNALKEKYPLSVCPDGQGAIMNYVKKAPDVLFLDIGLPDIDGHKVLEKIFTLDPNAYVVMFSGNGDRENVMKAIALGAKGFVGKPFTKDKLLHYIEKSPFIQAKTKETLHENRIR